MIWSNTKISSPDSKSDTSGCFFTFFAEHSSLPSAQNVKKQQEVSDLIQDYNIIPVKCPGKNLTNPSPGNPLPKLDSTAKYNQLPRWQKLNDDVGQIR